MMLNKLKKLSSLGLAVCAVNASAVQKGQLAPPEVIMTDGRGVNLASGQVTSSVETVSIGGESGLSHSVSVHGNAYNNIGFYGYVDKYAGNASYRQFGSGITVDSTFYNYPHMLTVFGPAGSATFKVMVNGQYQEYANGLTSGYTYEALRDKRHTLEPITLNGSPYLKWTTPDGTELYYARGSSAAGAKGEFSKIVYPNGVTVTVNGVGGVTSNLGYQLKYEFVSDSRALAPSKQTILSQLPSTNQLPPVSPGQWSDKNPKRIWAINNAWFACEEYGFCDGLYEVSDLDSDGMTLPESIRSTVDWPYAQFDWPGGMPTAIFLGNTTLTVTDAMGRTTEHHYMAQDIAAKNPYDLSKGYIDQFTWDPGEKWSARLVGIKTAASQSTDYTYTFDNKFDAVSADWFNIRSEDGTLMSAQTPMGNVSYNIDQANLGATSNASNLIGKTGSWLEIQFNHSQNPGAPIMVHSKKNGYYFYQTGPSDRLLSFEPVDGPKQHFYYDSRGNLEQIVMLKGESNETTMEAGYPTSCTSSNRKYCNKPSWIKDAKGNTTYYEYHAASGQVCKITGPADKHGVSPQTRYAYQQKSAYYYQDGASSRSSGDPVWMLTKEAFCKSSSATAFDCNANDGSIGGCSGSNDQVVTEYSYGSATAPNNLQVRAVTVNPDGEPARTTCYRYDIYGNKIGETSPRGAGLSGSSCE